jgi:hypothetical protein
MRSETPGGHAPSSRGIPTGEAPRSEQVRLATIIARADAFAAQLRITATWRPATVRALLRPEMTTTRCRLAQLLHCDGGEP